MPNLNILECDARGYLTATQAIPMGVGAISAPFNAFTVAVLLTTSDGSTAFITLGASPTAMSNGIPVRPALNNLPVVGGNKLAVL